MIELAPEEYHEDMSELYRRLRNVWMAYLRGQIVLMLVVGIVFTIAWLIGFRARWCWVCWLGCSPLCLMCGAISCGGACHGGGSA